MFKLIRYSLLAMLAASVFLPQRASATDVRVYNELSSPIEVWSVYLPLGGTSPVLFIPPHEHRDFRAPIAMWPGPQRLFARSPGGPPIFDVVYTAFATGAVIIWVPSGRIQNVPALP